MSESGLDIALAGATGAVGKEMVSILEASDIAVRSLHPLNSGRVPGQRVAFRGEQIEVRPVDGFDFSKAQLALFSMGGGPSRKHAPRAAEAGCLVVDNSSAFRRDDDVPLVVSEVNAGALDERPPRGIVANPNCSTMQLLVAVAPIHRQAAIERMHVATYQAVSGAGAKAIEDLKKQTAAALEGKRPGRGSFQAPISFNVIPHIDEFQDNGFTREEMKIVWETHKILGDERIKVSATAVRVPVVTGHSEAVHLTTERYLGSAQARTLLAGSPGVTVIDRAEPGGYPTPLVDADGSDDVFVGRIRDDLNERCGLHLWVVSDNLRKGAALNAVQLARILAGRHCR